MADNKNTNKENHVFTRLMELAVELNTYTQNMDFGGFEQKQQAKNILIEIERLMQMRNEWAILCVLEASVVPKMTRLAKDIHLYKQILSSPSQKPRQKAIHAAPRRHFEITHRNSAYDHYQAPLKRVEPNATEKAQIGAILDDLQQNLAEHLKEGSG